MANTVNLVTKQFTIRDKEAIHLGRQSQRHVPVVDIVETLYRVDNLLLVLLIP